MREDKDDLHTAFREGLEAGRITSYVDAIARACIIAFAAAVAWIVPTAWYWKAVVFLAIMFVAGIVVPAIKQRREDHMNRWAVFLSGVVLAALSLAGFWCYFKSGWVLWLRIPALILAVIWGLTMLRAFWQVATNPHLL